jgi:hypothetical protein
VQASTCPRVAAASERTSPPSLSSRLSVTLHSLAGTRCSTRTSRSARARTTARAPRARCPRRFCTTTCGAAPALRSRGGPVEGLRRARPAPSAPRGGVERVRGAVRYCAAARVVAQQLLLEADAHYHPGAGVLVPGRVDELSAADLRARLSQDAEEARRERPALRKFLDGPHMARRQRALAQAGASSVRQGGAFSTSFSRRAPATPDGSPEPRTPVARRSGATRLEAAESARLGAPAALSTSLPCPRAPPRRVRPALVWSLRARAPAPRGMQLARSCGRRLLRRCCGAARRRPGRTTAA